MSVPYVLHMFEALYPQQQSKKNVGLLKNAHLSTMKINHEIWES